jgi:hypothetical protein
MITHLEVGFALRCFQRLSKSEHSYPAMPLAGQLADQWFVHSGPLVAILILIIFKIKLSPISRSADYTFTRLHSVRSEGGGMLPIYTVALNGAIRCYMSPSIFQLKSLRGQTKHSEQLFFCFFLLGDVILLLHNEREFY